MARKEQTGSGVARGGRSGARSGAQARGGRKRRTQASKRTTRRSAHPRTAAMSQTASQTAVSGLRPTAGSAWGGVAGAASPASLLTLTADQATAGGALTLTGAERATLGEALHAWGAARDQAANRAWRRPGGLTRMAGL